MSSYILASSSKRLSIHVPKRTSVRFASKQEVQGDPKKDILRRVLYPSNIRNTATPTGTWRPDVELALQRAIPSVQAHDTIERAWLLYKRHLRKSRDAELARKFDCMHRAMEELRSIDMELYKEANRQEDPRARTKDEVERLPTMRASEKKALDARIRGLFPRELRPPSDTPPRDGWNYDYKTARPKK
ncbi:hypothetical protein PLICRDRAFT_36249 [Plicaturopsis crispa FD-325 SS-3]|nr:hypothetical protein PLICRDRAFT_36249 [Plicaturopsis crispa FD-325 SS-3]